MKKIVSVIGPSEIDEEEYERVQKIGEILGEYGFVVATGGLSGVMEAALKGAKKKGTLTIGVLPSLEKKANPYVDICINTGLGSFRNYILVAIGDMVVCTGLSRGTWTELTMALKLQKEVIFLSKEKIPFEEVKTFENLEDFEKYIKGI